MVSGLDPVEHVLTRPWEDLTTKTRSLYTNVASSAIAEVVRTLAPDSSLSLWKAIKSNDSVDTLLDGQICESYKQASGSETRRQLLSLVAHKVTYQEILPYIPDMTRYQFTAARKHAMEVGAGQAVEPPTKQVREKIDARKMEHFLDFITASNIVQDLPFGQRTLTLSNDVKLQIPNVIRTLIPSRLIVQYQQYCKENSYEPLSRSTLFRILSRSCLASVRKSLQGLDSYAADGGRAFDDLATLLDTLSTYGLEEATASKIRSVVAVETVHQR